jgi:hypothetical protein
VKLIGYVLSVAAALAISAQASPLKGKAVVRAMRGEAQFNSNDQGYKPVALGMIFSSGTVIHTGEDSQMDLFLPDNGSALRLMANTDLAINTLRVEEIPHGQAFDTILNLNVGRILCYIKGMAGVSRYEVRSPRAMVAIREAGGYEVRADGTIRVDSGTALAKYGIEFRLTMIKTGETGKPPLAPGQTANVVPSIGPSESLELRELASQWSNSSSPGVPPSSPERSPDPTPMGKRFRIYPSDHRGANWWR